jgi:hypothetical protein
MQAKVSGHYCEMHYFYSKRFSGGAAEVPFVLLWSGILASKFSQTLSHL